MKKIILSAAVLSVVVLMSACKKDKHVTNNFNDSENITRFFSKHAPKAETFVVNATTGGSITTTKGTKITFPPLAFVNAADQVVNGNVNVHVRDILKPSDMILGDKPTIDAKGGFLRSFGELIVKADQNGAELDVKKDVAQVVVPLGIREAQGQGNKIPLWDGDTTIATTTSGHNHLNVATSVASTYTIPKGVAWVDLGTVAISNPQGTESSFLLDALGNWRNCDALLNTPGTKVTVLGYFNNHYNGATGSNYTGIEPCMLFFKQKNVNTLIKLYNVIMNAPAGKEGLLSYQNSFTSGTEGTFLAISAKDGKFYASMRDITIPQPNSGDNYVGFDFSLDEVSENTLLSLINQMNSK